jgi:DNA-binding IclR family transcriptional regulator
MRLLVEACSRLRKMLLPAQYHSSSMARPAPAVGRAVALLDVLIAHPDQHFTLSELVRRGGVGLGSAHAVLAELEEVGYVRRHPTTKAYSLGAALAVAGAVALRQQPALAAAIDELAALARDVGAEALVTAPTTDEIVFVARAGRASPRSPNVREGERVPLVPPLGAVFMAWATPAEVARWLARAPSVDTARAQAALSLARSRGYSIGSASDTQRAFGATVFSLADAAGSQAVRADLDALLASLADGDYPLASLDAGELFDVGMIAAPVFDGDQRVVAAIAATGFARAFAAEEVVRAAERVRDAAAVATKRGGGRPSPGG